VTEWDNESEDGESDDDGPEQSESGDEAVGGEDETVCLMRVIRCKVIRGVKG
jgi:hypothetical protein